MSFLHVVDTMTAEAPGLPSNFCSLFEFVKYDTNRNLYSDIYSSGSIFLSLLSEREENFFSPL